MRISKYVVGICEARERGCLLHSCTAVGLDDGDVHPSIHPGASKLMSCNRRASEGDFSSEEAKMCEQPIPFWSE